MAAGQQRGQVVGHWSDQVGGVMAIKAGFQCRAAG